MTDAEVYGELAGIVVIPMTCLAINALDYFLRRGAVGTTFICIRFDNARQYLVMNWLLLAAIVAMILGTFFRELRVVFPYMLPAWFAYINLHAIVTRRLRRHATDAPEGRDRPH